ncbi:cytochrome P450 6j1-like [Periplaneta americana]|uniref:cytochrome P450 6j1-like n=1 Tax=Periplaneta americana TaxID=6978 RepID=UPI0037E9780A
MLVLGFDAGWLACCACSAVLLYLYLTWTHGYWRKRRVPYIKPRLLFGNIKDVYLGKKTLGELYQDLYRELDGKQLGGIFKFRQPMLLLRDPQLIESVIVTHFDCFHDNDFEVDVETYPLIGRNLLYLKGQMWDESKPKLRPAFETDNLKLMFPVILGVCQHFISHLTQEKYQGGLREATELAKNLSEDSVATCAYGMRHNSFQNSRSEFRVYCRNFFQPTIRKGIAQSFLFIAPRLSNFFGLRIIPSKVADFFRQKTKESMAYRQQNNIRRNDYLQYLLQVKKSIAAENDLNNTATPWYKKFTDEDVAAHALTFFTEGYETCAVSLSMLLYYLACNRDVQIKLIQEVDFIIKKHNYRLNLDVIEDMQYLDMVVKESLRMNAPVPFITRLCTKRFELHTNGGDLTIQKGTPMVIPVLALHNDPKFFPHPKTFDPERFNKSSAAQRPRCTYLPFGAGPRTCLGSRYALALIKCCMVLVLLQYYIKKCRYTPRTTTAVPTSFIYTPKEKLWIEFVKRDKK